MKVKEMKIADLVPYENNPRKNDDAVDAVAASLKEFGWQQPIVVDTSGVIIVGHTRLKAAQKLGFETAPVVVADELTEEQVRAYRLADNKTAEFADWNVDLLDLELSEIKSIDMAAFGFDIGEDEEPEAVGDNYIEPDDLPSRAEEGGCWALGDHILYVGDATKEKAVETACPEPADLLITDPPYNVALGVGDTPEIAKKRRRRTDGLKISNDAMGGDDFLSFLRKAFKASTNRMKDGAAYYVWYASTSQKSFQEALEQEGLPPREILIWVKNTFVLGRQDYHWRHEPCFYGWKDGAAHYFIDDRKQSTIIEDREPDLAHMTKAEMKELLRKIYDDGVSTTVIRETKPSVNALHPTMKPVPLIGRLIKNSSKPGQIVLDPFGGSGTTMIACEQLGRRCRMLELDPHYADVIIDRWETFTGRKAVRADV